MIGNKQEKLSLFLVLIFGAVLLFWNLHAIALFEPDEGRYGDIALTMIKSGDWLIPKMNHLVHIHKPPLSSWLVASSMTLLGPSEFSARLPGVLLSLLILLGVVCLGKKLFSFRVGVISALVLITSTLFLVTSRLVTTDMTLTFLTFVAMVAFLKILFTDKYKLTYFYTAFIALGLAMLTKGPVSWMITLLPLVIFCIWRRRRFHIPLIHWFLALIIFLGISLSWYLVVIASLPGSYEYFINDQLLGRIKGGMGHAHSIFYFLIVFPLGMFPWSLFLPSSVIWNLKTTKESKDERDKILFFLLWFLVPFICFSLITTKLSTYVVPLFIPAAILLGKFWEAIDSGEVDLTKPLRVIFWFFSVIYTVFAIAALVFISIRPKFVEGIPPWGIGLAVAFFLAISICNIFLLRKKEFKKLFRFQILAMFGISIIGFSFLPYLHFKNMKVFVQKANELRAPDDILIMYHRYYASMPFYANERVTSVGTLRETQFETKANVDKYVIPEAHFLWKFIEGPNRIFALSTYKHFKEAKAQTEHPLYEILRRGKYILFSNQE